MTSTEEETFAYSLKCKGWKELAGLCCVQSLSHVWPFVTPWTVAHRLLCPWRISRQGYWSELQALLQGIFPTQGSNPGLPHCRPILDHLSHQGSLRILEWAVYLFSGGSSWSRSRTKMSFIAGGFFTSWATREAWRELTGALGLNNWYWDVKQSYAFRKRIYWPGDFLQLEFKLSALSSSIWGLRLSAFICELRACGCSQ